MQILGDCCRCGTDAGFATNGLPSIIAPTTPTHTHTYPLNSPQADQRLKPHIHRTWNILYNLRKKLHAQHKDLGPTTTACLRSETNGRRWFQTSVRSSLEDVLTKAVEKCDKYLSLLSFAKSARLFDPRQRPYLDKNISAYVTVVEKGTKDTGPTTVYRVIPESDRACIEKDEWDKYWALPEMPNTPLDLVGWWVGMQSELPCMAKLALRTLPIPHTGVDVERSFSYYRISRSVLQSALTPEHHIGRLSFRMNGIVPPVSNK